MIVQIERALEQYAPDFRPAAASVVCIQTTRPKYLVFGDSSDRPACVVQFGEIEELRRVQRTLEQLHARLPGDVPAPIACGPFAGTAVQIQSGLDGAPWFRLQRTTGPDAWARLEREALASLEALQGAVIAVSDWTGLVSPVAAVSSQLELACASGAGLSSSTAAAVRRLLDETPADDLAATAQHGDYGLNNLLRTEDGRMRIIDFEEFGLTSVPLHDEIGLALSIRAVGGADAGQLPLADHVARCVRGALQRRPELRPMAVTLAVHHVLWRINRSHGSPNRERMKRWLIETLDQLLQSPSAAFLQPAAVR